MKQIKRVIVKVTGESFCTNTNSVDFNKFSEVAKKLINIKNKAQTQLIVVVGGGNIFRGRQANPDVDSVEADYMGMMATIINGIGLREAFVRNGEEKIKLMSAFGISDYVELYNQEIGKSYLDEGNVLIISGGLGKPGFTTDSAVANYAAELDCGIIFKASTVDGVYDKDPNKYSDAVKFEKISFDEALNKKLAVMDATAFDISKNSQIPIFVFKSEDINRIPEAINGDFSFGTLISTKTKDEKISVVPSFG